MLTHMVELFRQWRFWKQKRRRWRGRSLSSPALSHSTASSSSRDAAYPDLAVSSQDLRHIEDELRSMEKTTARLLSKLNEAPDDPPTSSEDECVICVSSRACLQTFPCGHRVLCRRCFVKTIQMAVAERALPLRCVVCRSKIARLKHQSSGRRVRVLVQSGPPPPPLPLGLSPTPPDPPS